MELLGIGPGEVFYLRTLTFYWSSDFYSGMRLQAVANEGSMRLDTVVERSG